MGCDIHLYAEKKVNDQWVTIDKWSDNPDYKSNPEGEKPKIIKRGWSEDEIDDRFYTDGRNYNLFCALAGVRKYIFSNDPTQVAEEKGFPQDACNEIKEEYDSWGSDAHTASWLTLGELESYDWSEYGETCNDFRNEVIPKMKAENVPPDDVRIVFWFDN